MVFFQLIIKRGVPMNDLDVISVLRNENEEYQKLELEHKKFELALDELNKKKYLTPEDETEKKTIQKQKLHLKDRMAQLVKEHQ